ncbi:hypothetical protein AB0H67_31200 [Streptomyces phaeochromogenes]
MTSATELAVVAELAVDAVDLTDIALSSLPAAAESRRGFPPMCSILLE